MLKTTLKKLLPKPVKRMLLLTQQKWVYGIVWFFSRSRWLSSLFYCLLSREFSREHQSVLKGRLAYLKQQGMQNDSSTLLRRNIHRIEKGLIMQPRKPVFALDYISETVGAYIIANGNANHDVHELKWAGDVLGEYFDSVDLDRLEPQLKRTFDAIKRDDNTSPQSVPYTFASKKVSAVDSESFMALCTQRRSVRWFESRTVERALLEQAVAIASLAPSACNRQPYKFYIAHDKALSQRLIDIPMGTKGFAHNVPCTIVVAADLANYPTERDRHLIYIDGSLAAMQLMLALETLGLSSCPINWPDIERTEQKMAKTLTMPDTVRPIMLMAVGYGLADGKIPYSHKKSAQQLIEYISS